MSFSREEVVAGRSCSFRIKLERCSRHSLFAGAKSNFDEEIVKAPVVTLTNLDGAANLESSMMDMQIQILIHLKCFVASRFRMA
jgi:hypothetical protein